MKKAIFVIGWLALLALAAGIATATGQYHQAQAAAPAQDEPLPGAWGDLEQATPDDPAWLCVIPLAIVFVIGLAAAMSRPSGGGFVDGHGYYARYQKDMAEADAEIDARRKLDRQVWPDLKANGIRIEEAVDRLNEQGLKVKR